jgi:ketosteroid isomerase-like protein
MDKIYKLPEVIEMHFNAANIEDSSTFLLTFHEDAVVIDAGKEYHGKAAIKKWSDQTYFGDHLRLKITNVVQDSLVIVVTAIADGDFDKTGLPDPLYFDFHFTLCDSKIKSLNITLVDE